MRGLPAVWLGEAGYGSFPICRSTEAGCWGNVAVVWCYELRLPSPRARAAPAEPAIGKIEMDLLAQSPLGSDAVAVADDQHPEHQFGLNRGPAGGTVGIGQMRTEFAQIEVVVDGS